MSNVYKRKRQASFRGLPFLYENHGFSGGGRNFVTHQFPNGRSHKNEDLSPNVPTVKVTGYFIGLDAVEQAEQMRSICSRSGSGTLVLPDKAFSRVRCKNYSFDANKDEVNKVKISFEFTEETSSFSGLTFFAGRLLEIGLGVVGASIGRMFKGSING